MIFFKPPIFLWLLISLTLATCTFAKAKSEVANDYSQVISDYLQLPEKADHSLVLNHKSLDKDSGLVKLSYTFFSQTWPKVGLESDQKEWQHHLDIYIPQKITSKTALLWINGGTLYELDESNPSTHTPYILDFATIANTTHSVVIDLQDVPNQYFTLNGKQYAEDDLIAYTWAKFLEDPITYKYYSAYLPMVKSVVRALDIVSDFKLDGYEFKIDNFVLAGSSKRGMTAWLTALHDDRIKAIMPVVIDLLNFKANINHIYQTYQEWPIALHNYYEHNIVQQLSHPQIDTLLKMHDPLEYINCQTCQLVAKQKFKQRLSIDKYIVLASGDDFFVPDSLSFYYKNLPVNRHHHNSIRYVPNARHFLDADIISAALLTYFYNINTDKVLPELTYSITQVKTQDTKSNKYTITVTSNTKPSAINLYQAHNPQSRDFRLANKIQYEKITINEQPKIHSKNFIYSIEIVAPKAGWQASFVELEYDQGITDIPPIKLTTRVEILPRKYPAKISKSQHHKSWLQYGSEVLYPEKL